MTLRNQTDPFRMVMPRRIVDLVGIELEGAWDTAPAGLCLHARERHPCVDSVCPVCLPHRASRPDSGRSTWTRYRTDYVPDAAYHADGSVSFQGPHAVIGEIVSKPLRVREVEPWAKQWWPEAVNKTCGLHVHMSFLVPVSHVAGLISDHADWFDETFRERMAVIGHRLGLGAHFRNRLEGQNSYCLPGIVCNSSDRYRQVNLAAAWKHKTIECRLLPAIGSKETGIKAILATVGTIDRMVRFLIARERMEPATVSETIVSDILIPEAINAERQETEAREAAARAAQPGNRVMAEVA